MYQLTNYFIIWFLTRHATGWIVEIYTGFKTYLFDLRDRGYVGVHLHSNNIICIELTCGVF